MDVFCLSILCLRVPAARPGPVFEALGCSVTFSLFGRGLEPVNEFTNHNGYRSFTFSTDEPVEMVAAVENTYICPAGYELISSQIRLADMRVLSGGLPVRFDCPTGFADTLVVGEAVVDVPAIAGYYENGTL